MSRSRPGASRRDFRMALVLIAGIASIFITPIVRFGAAARAGDSDATKPRDRVFVGYLYGSTRGIDFKLYTHLCHAFLVADGDGRIQKRDRVPDPALAAQAHQAGVKMLVSLGGWGWDQQFASIVSHPDAEDRYVEAVVKLVDESDYDGIDLDWEYPDTKTEVVGFERLTRRLRKGLDVLAERKHRPMLLTMAASSNPPTLRWLDPAFLTESMDWVNVMTYDYTGDWTDYAGHHSPLFASSKAPQGGGRSTERTMRYLVEERKLPPDRLVVGVPLYGRGFAVAEPYASTRNAPRRRLPGGNYASLDRLLREERWTRIWDDETKNPWLLSPKRDVVIGYDDVESVGIKTEWAMKQGFRGVFFWQVGADRLGDGSHPLQEASRKAFDRGRGQAPR